MKTFAFAAIAGLAAAEMTAEMTNYMNYISQYEKSYDSMEDFYGRFQLFQKTEANLAKLNSKNSQATFGHNAFSDWTRQEYMSMLGLRYEETPAELYINKDANLESTSGDSVDWRDVSGVVTPVKDQGQCGSCWAFSATEAVESAYVIAGNDQVIMSPQELVDCSKGILSNHGCNGGMYYNAWKWEKTHMAMKESDYPYVSGTTKEADANCSYDESKGVTFVSGYEQVSADTDSIKAAIKDHGPVSIAINAETSVFQSYKTGIITEADGCPTKIDHAVLAVGYGYEGDQGYFIVRNSWNTIWGDEGYVKLGMAEGAGVCGMNQVVYYPEI
jgi:cathepsin L